MSLFCIVISLIAPPFFVTSLAIIIKCRRFTLMYVHSRTSALLAVFTLKHHLPAYIVLNLVYSAQVLNQYLYLPIDYYASVDGTTGHTVVGLCICLSAGFLVAR